MSRSKVVVASSAAALTLTLVAASTSSAASSSGPVLAGRAVLGAEVLSDGPASGAALVPAGQTTTVINGISFPRPHQPVIGFSALLDGDAPGEYLAMPDNGYGSKANSADFLLRAYHLRPDFKTAKGGSGSVEVGDYIQFADPNHVIGFPIVHENDAGRPLTGADVDPESLQRDVHGDFWMGDEFGPWILHFDADGTLLEAPFALPDGLHSPSNPLYPNAANDATTANSRGIEAMALTPDEKHLIVFLEGALRAEVPSTRRIVFEFDIPSRSFTDRRWEYRTAKPEYMVADAVALDMHRVALIERDGGRGLTATFRQIRVVDLNSVDPTTGAVKATTVVDLTAIPDPDGVSLPPLHPGDVGLGDPFRVTCESIEALHLLDQSRFLVGCDNNLPNDGRNPTRADDSEFIVVRYPGMRGGT